MQPGRVRVLALACLAALSAAAVWSGTVAGREDPSAWWPFALTWAASLPTVAVCAAGFWHWRARGFLPGRGGRYCLSFALGTLWGLAAVAAGLAVIGFEGPPPGDGVCGVLRPACASAVGLWLSHALAVVTFGLWFPGLLPFLAACPGLVRPGRLSGRWITGIAVFVTGLATVAAALTGLAVASLFGLG